MRLTPAAARVLTINSAMFEFISFGPVDQSQK
jgi:hypothetical protein